MVKKHGTQLDEADTEAEAWRKARIYAELLRSAGLAGKWQVRPEANVRDASSSGGWRVIAYDERLPGDRSVSDLYGLLRLSQHGHVR